MQVQSVSRMERRNQNQYCTVLILVSTVVFDYYSTNTCGVDMLDAMCRLMSTKAACRRWPLAVNILDVAGINAWIIYRKVTGSIMWRRDFLHLSWCVLQRRTVTRQWICSRCRRRRCSNHGVNCQVKAQCNRNRTVTVCERCNPPVCGKCVAKVCAICK